MSAIGVVRYRMDEGSYGTLIMRRGHKYLHVISILGEGLKVRKVPLTEERNMTPLLYKGAPYPVARAIRKFRKIGKSLGMTDEANRLLKDALAAEKHP